MTLQQLQTFEASCFARIVAAHAAAVVEEETQTGRRDRTRRGTAHGDAMAARRAARRQKEAARFAFLDSVR